MNVRLVSAGVALVVASGVGTAQDLTFRAASNVVTVDAFVRDRQRVVGDLTAADLEVTDNGHVQRLADVAFESAPVEATLVVDTSSSVQGPLLGALIRAVEAARQRLRPTDRISLVRFNRAVTQGPLAPTDDVRRLLTSPGGETSLVDAVVASLIRPTTPGLRQLVVVFTDGADTSSFIDEQTLRQVAQRAEAAVFVVAALDGPLVRLAHLGLFETITADTGGRFAAINRNGNLSEAFAGALDEFRQSYVLRYLVQGDLAPGWHDVGVRVLRPGTFSVRARRGYFVPAPSR